MELSYESRRARSLCSSSMVTVSGDNPKSLSPACWTKRRHPHSMASSLRHNESECITVMEEEIQKNPKQRHLLGTNSAARRCPSAICSELNHFIRLSRLLTAFVFPCASASEYHE